MSELQIDIILSSVRGNGLLIDRKSAYITYSNVRLSPIQSERFLNLAKINVRLALKEVKKQIRYHETGYKNQVAKKNKIIAASDKQAL